MLHAVAAFVVRFVFDQFPLHVDLDVEHLLFGRLVVDIERVLEILGSVCVQCYVAGDMCTQWMLDRNHLQAYKIGIF